MEIVRRVKIVNEKGLHTRAVAMTVHQANELGKKYNTKLFLRRLGISGEIPANSMLALVSMRIRKDEVIEVVGKGVDPEKAVANLVVFLSGDFEFSSSNQEEVDEILESTSIVSDKIFASMANGLIAVDEKNRVTIFNKAAEKITGLKTTDVIGKNILDFIEGAKLDEVIQEGKAQIGFKEAMGSSTIITNRSPIFSEDKIIGAVAIFQDISEFERLASELKSTKELKERFQYLLETVHDAISMVDSQGIITYVNSAYERIRGIKKEEIIGKSIFQIYPESYLAKALKENKAFLEVLTEKEDGTKLISSISPVIVDDELKGAVAVSKELNQIQRLAEKLQKAMAKAEYLEEELIRKQKLDKSFEIIIGNSGPLQEALSIASKASQTSATVLIRGESGTGKEMVATAIHYASKRKNHPFIRVNCAAIPTNLLESELFGYEAGAFTGANKQKPGRFELAHQGTIFLDEVGDMSLNMQAKLLRVIQEREFERIGGIKSLQVSVRIIAATNRNLEEMLVKGEFREDLYYRLNVIPVCLPSLRERRSDIPLLAEFFLKKISQNIDKQIGYITPEAMECLVSYRWPGNIRELENIIERSCILAEKGFIQPSDLPSYVSQKTEQNNHSLINTQLGIATMEEYEKTIIGFALEKYKTFNQTGKALGITHKTVAAKARKYGLLEQGVNSE